MTIIQVNEVGEVPGYGPVHACAGFGAPGHDYQTCEQCRERFAVRMQKLGVA